MAILPSLDKLTIINQALVNSSNNIVETEADGSDEWIAGSSAYDQWFPILLARKTWNFDTRVLALDRLGDSDFPPFTDKYAKPSDSLYIQKLWNPTLAGFMLPYTGFGIATDEDIRIPSLDYRIVGDTIHTSAPDGVTCKYAVASSDPTHWTVGFVAALRLKIEAVLYRALNEDTSEANRCAKEAEIAFNEAAARSNSEEPRRVGFRSSLAESRRYGRRRAV